mgnify:FL=1
MIGRIIVNPSEDNTDTNGTDTNDTSGTADNNSVNSSSSLNGVAVVPAFLVIALVSRYLR